MLAKRLICSAAGIVLFALLHTGSFAAAADVTITSEEMRLVRQAQDERAAAIEKVQGSVVAIFGANPKEGGGSGVLFDEAGFVLTNHHVVAGAGVKGKAGLSDGELYDWKLVGTDPAGDLAVIQLEGKDTWPIAPLGDSDRVRTGDWAMAMGNPFTLAADYSPTVTLGIVSGIQRYQGGGMVYGNCIQVDSAINPGNSGGPLMNMAGEVIGINGRAAFAERGRVNVGVGFAISMKQVKNFIPALLACKVARHGTLDAQFGMRGGKVICEAINLDSRAARAGLKLGDRLVSVNGERIQTSNQLANLMSMMPSDWPVNVVYEHKGREFDFAIRLSPLVSVARQAAVEMPQREMPEEEPQKEEQEDAEREDDDAGPEEDMPNGDEPERQRRRRRPKLPKLVPGAVLYPEVNIANAMRVIERWQSAGKRGTQVVAVEWRDQTVAEAAGEEGKASCVLTSDGQFMVDDGETVTIRTETGYYQKSDGDLEERSLDEVLSDPHVLSIAIQAARFDPKFKEVFGQPELFGADLVEGKPVFCLKFTQFSRPLFVWLSMDSTPELVKAGFDRNGTLTRPVVTFARYELGQTNGELSLALERRLVRGVASEVSKTWRSGDFKVIAVPDAMGGQGE